MTNSVDHIIAYLERLRRKPGMYIGSDITRLLPHLQGFQAGCAIHGFQPDAAIWMLTVQRRLRIPPHINLSYKSKAMATNMNAHVPCGAPPQNVRSVPA